MENPSNILNYWNWTVLNTFLKDLHNWFGFNDSFLFVVKSTFLFVAPWMAMRGHLFLKRIRSRQCGRKTTFLTKLFLIPFWINTAFERFVCVIKYLSSVFLFSCCSGGGGQKRASVFVIAADHDIIFYICLFPHNNAIFTAKHKKNV